ncbi:MAG: 6-carboxytetrahydropterin synthase [Planctomycetes bacterium]|nr:6-carboxytetrahydropterin synthase [Planctomycetota bacterium]
MKVGVMEHVDSMHLLPGHRKCGVPHGHTYRVEVAVEGPVNDGMVIDFDVLKSQLREVLKEFDHVDLNRIIAYPSCENIAMEILRRLKARIPDLKMEVRIWEGEGKWAQCEG